MEEIRLNPVQIIRNYLNNTMCNAIKFASKQLSPTHLLIHSPQTLNFEQNQDSFMNKHDHLPRKCPMSMRALKLRLRKLVGSM